MRFGGCKRQSAVLARYGDRQTVWKRADAAGMDVSRFIVKRLTARPAVPEDKVVARDLVRAAARIERAARVLYEIDGRRVEYGAGAETWERLLQRAGARVDAEARLG